MNEKIYISQGLSVKDEGNGALKIIQGKLIYEMTHCKIRR